MADPLAPASQLSDPARKPVLTLRHAGRCVAWSFSLSILLWGALLAVALPHAPARLHADLRMALSLPAQLVLNHHHDATLLHDMRRALAG